MPWQLFWTLMAQALIASVGVCLVTAMFRSTLGKDRR